VIRRLLVIGALALPAAQGLAVDVNLELSLLMDVSGSTDASEFTAIRQAHANVFLNPTFYDTVVGPGRSLAVNLVEFDGNSNQSEVIGWTLINSQAAATVFGTAIQSSPRAFPGGQTGIGQALNYAYPRIFNNTFTSDRQVIDVCGDGAENVDNDPFVDAARNSALTAGVDQINGLAILGELGLEAWYRAHVMAGDRGFVLTTDMNTIGAQVNQKLSREISENIPAPASLLIVAAPFVLPRRRRT
jgi:Protein of unknown function (DUF1194)